MFAYETVILAKTKVDQAIVSDNDTLQAQELVKAEGNFPGFPDNAAPSLNAVLRRAFALDGIT